MANVSERHKIIIEELKRTGYVRVKELSEKLNVSEVTIRKDLKKLENRKMLYRNHGSANSVSSIIGERHIDEKEKIRIEEKTLIAKAATELLDYDDKVIIASGTTLLAFAREIREDKPLTVITSSIKVSIALCYNPSIEVIQLGGVMRKKAASVIGNYAEKALDELVCNKLFIGVDGIDLDYGLTTSNLGEAHLNQKMINAAQKIIVLCDSSKFGKKGFSKICNFDMIHHIITDSNAPSNIIEMIKEKGIEVTLV
ncbi:MAG: DeoR/GlpR family DNA-binding transcription regulator [Dysgonomonas sp.]